MAMWPVVVMALPSHRLFQAIRHDLGVKEYAGKAGIVNQQSLHFSKNFIAEGLFSMLKIHFVVGVRSSPSFVAKVLRVN